VRRHRAEGKRRFRVALLAGCAQRVLDPAINEAAIRLLTRLGGEVVVPAEVGCCGGLTHHMGRHDQAMASARANVAAWSREAAGEGLDGIVVNASGCGTMLKDYGFMLRGESQAEAAALVSSLIGVSLPHDAVYFGEIALSGAVRAVGHSGLRLKEAAKLGFTRAVAPPAARKDGEGARLPTTSIASVASLVAEIAAAGVATKKATAR